jgi:predicted nucleic acid-binding protein
VLSPFVLAELNYLLARHPDPTGELAVLEDVANGAYVLAPFDATDVGAAAGVVRRYREHDIGLAEASIVVLAGRLETSRVLTLDERQFRVLRTPSGRRFKILPADA